MLVQEGVRLALGVEDAGVHRDAAWAALADGKPPVITVAIDHHAAK